MIGKIILLGFLLLEGISQNSSIPYEIRKDFVELFPSPEFLYFKHPLWGLPGSEKYINEKIAGKIVSKDRNFIGAKISAKSALVIDADTGQILYDKNANTRRQIGSLTKLMTALVFIERNPTLSEEIIVPEEALSAAREGSDIKLEKGEIFASRDLLEAFLIASANDAALSIALKEDGSEQDFVNLMNEKVLSLGLLNTHFANVTGFDSPENYSTAFDLVKIFKEAYKNDFIREVTKKKEGKIVSLNTGKRHFFKNTDSLIGSYLDIEAGKTGYTEEAGECLIILARSKERSFIAVVLGSEDRFQDAKVLISFVKDAYNIK